tara:strand:- start:3584 stop:4078 length:495 start_codon:yes stop_codon:yes gene_type:complete
MAKNKRKTTMMILAVVGILALWWVYRSRSGSAGKMANGSGNGNGNGNSTNTGLPTGCYPLEETHESGSHAGTMWVSIIPYLADGTTRIRPSSSTWEIGDQFDIQGTGSALDGVYTILQIWYDSVGDIGSLRVDIPSGYNFNYNSTQGGNPRDMTYYGIGRICEI